eukprot:SAG25_NODE_8647_length_411_cov_0.346154_1_plen_80_part_10
MPVTRLLVLVPLPRSPTDQNCAERRPTHPPPRARHRAEASATAPAAKQSQKRNSRAACQHVISSHLLLPTVPLLLFLPPP